MNARGRRSRSLAITRTWIVVVAIAGCARSRDEVTAAADAAPPNGSPSAAIVSLNEPPELLYLPDGGDQAPPTPDFGAPVLPPPLRVGRCPADMVDVAGEFCIDRYEASLVDAASGRTLSPFYHPAGPVVVRQFERWQRNAPTTGTQLARRLPVPAPPDFELRSAFDPKATALPDVLPNGYLNAVVAQRACQNAGKRLCQPEEWRRACRGQENRKFPYGAAYEEGRCNVHREAHPAALLHGNASIHHLDPRLNQVTVAGVPLLRKTGTSPDCVSRWGADGVYDMVGNLDEWVDDPEGTFQGGFYARATKEGCDARITSHAAEYFDYSLGVRCCR